MRGRESADFPSTIDARHRTPTLCQNNPILYNTWLDQLSKHRSTSRPTDASTMSALQNVIISWPNHIALKSRCLLCTVVLFPQAWFVVRNNPLQIDAEHDILLLCIAVAAGPPRASRQLRRPLAYVPYHHGAAHISATKEKSQPNNAKHHLDLLSRNKRLYHASSDA